MKIEEIKKMLEATGLPVAYDHFKKQTDPPFLVYLLPESRNIIADDCVYQGKVLVRIELYTDKKDPELEKVVETALADMVWTKEETYIDSEEMFEIMYEMEVMTE
ncbi:MAG: hypothetical protein MR278_09440 [Bacteroidales bacterium]|nr:hypothetical protein [Anaerotignum sp.]MCI5680176.1 hypothetical protein [Bacteroidales bacterium]MDY3926866.1 hypothetical protein [Anaerotignum sp.]